MRYLILALAILLPAALDSQARAQASLSVGIGGRGVSLGFSISTYPTLVRIPGYPVYYDPRVDLNYFFYDGLYWVFVGGDWYASSWYDGPWYLVAPVYVPVFVLRIPVRYYRRPPPYFRYWHPDAAPRWGEHWGPAWERERSGWDRWDRRTVPAPAPLPAYQREYSGSRYPRQQEQQRTIESSRYRYQPREPASRQLLDEQRRRDTERYRQSSQHEERVGQPQPSPSREVRTRQQEEVQHQRMEPPRTAPPAPRGRDADKGAKGRSDKGKGRAEDDRRDGDHP